MPPFSLRLRRHPGIISRQLFLSLGNVRSVLTQALAPRHDVGSAGPGGSAYIMRRQHDPVPSVKVQVDAAGGASCACDRDIFVEFGISSLILEVQAAAGIQLRRPFSR
eukprot:6780852-Pyramimonas_sp.AAC.1